MINAFKTMLKDMKATWKPALVTYLIAVLISAVTGIPMEASMMIVFGTIFLLLAVWSIYAFIKMKKGE